MKISVEPMEGFSFNVTEGTSEAVSGVRVEWQTRPKGKREHANIIMDSAEPAERAEPAAMLAAAAAYFKSQEIPF